MLSAPEFAVQASETLFGTTGNFKRVLRAIATTRRRHASNLL
jgi:hypothetical protein